MLTAERGRSYLMSATLGRAREMAIKYNEVIKFMSCEDVTFLFVLFNTHEELAERYRDLHRDMEACKTFFEMAIKSEFGKIYEELSVNYKDDSDMRKVLTSLTPYVPASICKVISDSNKLASILAKEYPRCGATPPVTPEPSKELNTERIITACSDDSSSDDDFDKFFM